jgi:hypothetical protein
MPTPTSAEHDEDDVSQAFYVRVMTRLTEAGIPFLVGGAFALARFTGIERNTKDFDLFVGVKTSTGHSPPSTTATA